MAADEERAPPPTSRTPPARPSERAGGRLGRLRGVFGGGGKEPSPAPLDARTEILEHTRISPRSAHPVSDLALVDSLLARLSREPEAADAVLRELGTTFFPVENGWRSLFTRLIQQPRSQPELKRLALEDYRRYLARREAERATGATPLMSRLPPPPAGTQGMERGEETPAPHLVRLPVGRPVAVRSPDEHRPFECRLASCVAWIRTGASPLFAIPDYRSFVLRDGRNLIGREPSGDIVIESRWSDVSRRHLMIDVTDLGRLILTDLSSFGTFVAHEAIEDND